MVAAVKRTLNLPGAKLIVAFASVYLVWGSTYLAIRFAIESIPTFLMEDRIVCRVTLARSGKRQRCHGRAHCSIGSRCFDGCHGIAMDGAVELVVE